MIFELPWVTPPLSMNGREHHMVKARKVRQMRLTAYSIALVRHLPVGLDHVTVALVYRPRDKRRRDADNLVPVLKACCDGLVDYGLTADDTPDQMTKHMPRIEAPVKGQPGAMWLEIEWNKETA